MPGREASPGFLDASGAPLGPLVTEDERLVLDGVHTLGTGLCAQCGVLEGACGVT